MKIYNLDKLSLSGNNSMHMNKEDFVALLECKHSAPFLFVGSGFSKHYLKTPKWNELLQLFAASHINSYYTRLESKDLSLIAREIAKERNEAFWKLPDEDPSKIELQEKIVSSSSVLKHEISKYLKKIMLEGIPDSFTEEINLLEKVNIDGIITTNWDDLTEILFPKFTTYVGQDELIFAPTFNIGEIYKIHGSIHNPESLVLTIDDYTKYNEKNAYLAAKLTTIFIEHPIVFLGYSISDTNVQQILSSIVKCLNSDNIQKLQNNLVFIEWSSEDKDVFLIEKYDILMGDGSLLPVTRITTNNYKEVYKCLQVFKREIPAHILRIYKESFYKIVYSENPEKQLCVIDENRMDKSKDVQFVCGFGAINKYQSAIGYTGLKSNNIFRDIIFDDGNYDAEKIIVNTLPGLKKATKFIPCYKYLRAVGINSNDDFNNNKLGITLNLETDFKCKYSDPTPYIEGKTAIDIIEENPPWKAAAFLTHINLKEEDLSIIREFCCEHYNQFLIVKSKPDYSTHLKKLICLYDWKKYGW